MAEREDKDGRPTAHGRAKGGLANVVGARVKERRKALGLTQQELCERIATVEGLAETPWRPTSYREVLNIERGWRIVTDLEVLILASALECSPKWLLTGETDQTQEEEHGGTEVTNPRNDRS